ncbi:hypothetical protein ZRA01_16590 [Zoogloea ramigera]|uniref:Uncharacterized protein n=1 Tax=Zoogloea ramigera TaxID=350 RepID=A0A4Y4CTC0_ZOORA|nr:hypothetical protein ZRA01_16590 [Zoogloea ramigera]
MPESAMRRSSASLLSLNWARQNGWDIQSPHNSWTNIPGRSRDTGIFFSILGGSQETSFLSVFALNGMSPTDLTAEM